MDRIIISVGRRSVRVESFFGPTRTKIEPKFWPGNGMGRRLAMRVRVFALLKVVIWHRWGRRVRVRAYPLDTDPDRNWRIQMSVGSRRRGRILVICVRAIDDLNPDQDWGYSPPPHGGTNLGSSSSSAPNPESHPENPHGSRQNYGDGGGNSNARSGLPNSSNSASDEKEAGSSRNIPGSEPPYQAAGQRETHVQGSKKRPFENLNRGDDGSERKKLRSVHEAMHTEIGTDENHVMAATNATPEQFRGKANAFAMAAARPRIDPKENVGHGENLVNQIWDYCETDKADDLSSSNVDQKDLRAGDDDETSKNAN